MQIFMLTSRLGSEDGHSLHYFLKFRHYDIADTLARYFINEGYAVESKYAALHSTDNYFSG